MTRTAGLYKHPVEMAPQQTWTLQRISWIDRKTSKAVYLKRDENCKPIRGNRCRQLVIIEHAVRWNQTEKFLTNGKTDGKRAWGRQGVNKQMADMICDYVRRQNMTAHPYQYRHHDDGEKHVPFPGDCGLLC